MMLRYLICLCVPFALFANSGEGTDYDIVERTINFLIFFSILYYLLASKIKDAYNARIGSIADKLESVQVLLKKTAQKREDAKKKVQNARDDVQALKESSKKELQILIEKLQSDVKSDLENLEKSHQERIDLEKRRMKREVIAEVLEQMFDNDTLKLKNRELVDIILKKVA